MFVRRRDRHAVESDARDIQYEQEKIPTEWRDSVILPIKKRIVEITGG